MKYTVENSAVTIESLESRQIFRLTNDISAQEYVYDSYIDGEHSAYKKGEHWPNYKPECFEHGTLVFPYTLENK